MKGELKMIIQSVLIDGFKNVSNVKIDLDSITALVGLNNYGKSNVLCGIDFGINYLKAANEKKIDMMSNSELIPINKNMKGRNFKFEIEALTNKSRAEYSIKYGYEFEWKSDIDKSPSVVREYLKIKYNVKGQKFVTIIERNKNAALYRSSETGRCTTKINIKSNELVVNKLNAFDKLYYSMIIHEINSMKMYMENNLDVESFYQPDPIIRKGIENEMINAGNLPRIIFNLKEENPDKFELLKDVYFQLFPDIEDVLVSEVSLNGIQTEDWPEDAPFTFNKTIYILSVKDKNLLKPVEFSMMSDGAKRVFMILAKIILSSISNISLVAVEEPENCVHPGLFQSYIQIMEQLLDDCKVIITSHSPYIVSCLGYSSINIGVNKTPGVAEFYSLKKKGMKQLEKDATKLNLSIGDYLFSIISDTDSNILEYLGCDANA